MVGSTSGGKEAAFMVGALMGGGKRRERRLVPLSLSTLVGESVVGRWSVNGRPFHELGDT